MHGHHSECNRLFIRADPIDESPEGVSWVQLNLTGTLTDRIRQLSDLLVSYHLETVTSEVEAIWCSTPGWQIHDRYLAPASWLEVWADGFSIKCMVDPASNDRHAVGQTRIAQASYLWGSVDEFIGDHRQDAGRPRWDDLGTAGGWTPPLAGEPDEMIVFARRVEEDLRSRMQPPLVPVLLCEQVLSRNMGSEAGHGS